MIMLMICGILAAGGSAGPWRKRYILAHSMGGAISTLFLQRHPGVCDAIALTAPMFGIVIRMPSFMARQILNWAEAHPRFRDGYAIGTGAGARCRLLSTY